MPAQTPPLPGCPPDARQLTHQPGQVSFCCQPTCGQERPSWVQEYFPGGERADASVPSLFPQIQGATHTRPKVSRLAHDRCSLEPEPDAEMVLPALLWAHRQLTYLISAAEPRQVLQPPQIPLLPTAAPAGRRLPAAQRLSRGSWPGPRTAAHGATRLLPIGSGGGGSPFPGVCAFHSHGGGGGDQGSLAAAFQSRSGRRRSPVNLSQ